MEMKNNKVKELSLEEKIDNYLETHLMPFHALLSKENMKLNDPKLDIAIEKLAQAQTVLLARAKLLRKESQ